ncbi:hypothetical protein QWZ04_19240 [Vibrio tapetis subsp. quintayensis]|uniref:hypothetical protein n=1 Tax=Vibrio tapetis TaxID=52443 RepID=UPI0025B4C5C3|nr:hypothetical protein [Vibrio tapetis]MDN3682443.1 hypothetical protein [Vibrio tapetis subsp. quintayensis]
MLSNVLAVLPAMLLGSQLILTVLLIKGEICPGQRGRIHKLLPALVALWLASSLITIEWLVVAGGLMYFYSQVQTKKTRDQGPIWILHLSNLFALFVLFSPSLFSAYFSRTLFDLSIMGYAGAVFAHLLMVVARSRLQAFHKILPVTGVAMAMFMVVCLLLKSLGMDETSVIALTGYLMGGLGLVVASIVAWCWHLMTHQPANKWILGAAVCLSVSALSCLNMFY